MSTASMPAMPGVAALAALQDGDPPWPEDAVEVARIVGAWGVVGGIKLKAYAGDPQALFSTKRWFLQPALPTAGMAAAGAAIGQKVRAKQAPMPRLLRVVKAREQGDMLVATVAEITDRDAAEALKGARVFVARGSFPSLSEDEFYWVDLIGMTVVNRAQVTLGAVVGLIETGPHSVLRIQPLGLAPAEQTDASEVLIPFVGVYVDQVDKAARCIRVDWGFEED